jgi:ribosomal protein S18 acetylase RimI-like enzyme
MAAEAELYYLYQPIAEVPVASPAEFLTVQDFLMDEPACRSLWELVSTQFRTRRKFLTIWQSVRYVTLIRDTQNQTLKGLLLVTTPINWQIDYVVVHPQARRQGVAAALVKTTLNHAFRQKIPYVMLTSVASLRPLYEGECGFKVVGEKKPAD